MKDLNIDWPLFHRQKAMLVAMANDKYRLTSEVEVLDGVINLMDGIQDALEPEKLDNGSMVKLNVALLEGAALDWAVAGCIPDGTRAIYFDEGAGEPLRYDDWAHDQQFSPTADWDQAGPLLVQHEIGVQPVYQDGVLQCWNARVHSLKYDECGEAVEGSDADSYGPTYLVAAMRCLVRSKMGPAMDIPEALAT